jgi:hypothetical protein
MPPEIHPGRVAHVLRSIRTLEVIASIVLILTIFISYSGPGASTEVFISFLVLILLHAFASRSHRELAVMARRQRILRSGTYACEENISIPLRVGAGLAVRQSFFILLLFFDTSWLSHAYLYPETAGSFQQFADQLAFGPLPGWGFLVFTFFFWAAYGYLFVVGTYSRSETDEFARADGHPAREGTAGRARAARSEEFWIPVEPAGGGTVLLQGFRIANAGKRPVILFPGFFQNGIVYDLDHTESLGGYLGSHGFDVWVVHSRGTAHSERGSAKTSLDDYAADDIPAIIQFVRKRTKMKPVFVGHSQGGISAIVSMMGPVKSEDGSVALSAGALRSRQNSLEGLVTIGSFPDFQFSKPSWLQGFVKHGIRLFNGRVTIFRAQWALAVLGLFAFIPVPFSYDFRTSLLSDRTLRVIAFPVVWLLNFASGLAVWEFLYHRPDASPTSRKMLLYKTIDGTFPGILRQFTSAIAESAMKSLDGRINYSEGYSRLRLPCSIVGMERDSLADPVMMKRLMFARIGSRRKFFTEWKGLGHEDHFMNQRYFPLVLKAVSKMSGRRLRRA